MKAYALLLAVGFLGIGGLILVSMQGTGATITNVISRCEETDHGLEFLRQGSVAKDGFFGEDHCEVAGSVVQSCRGRYCQLVEYSCRMGDPYSMSVPCPQFAAVCDRGACREPGAAEW